MTATYTDLPPQEQLYFAVGRFMSIWATFEVAFEMVIHAIHTSHGGDTIEKEIPRQWNRKWKFFRRCLVELPSLKKYNEPFSHVFPLWGTLSEARSWIAHSVALLAPGSSDTIRFSRHTKTWSIEYKDYRIAQVVGMSYGIGLLTYPVAHLSTDAKLFDDDIHDTFSGLAEQLIRAFELYKQGPNVIDGSA